ncbi:Transposase DDE domain protein [Streptomyces sp. MP131-18]|nr:Transposase DDE domain protein [Streptomyces sp. MP131-18]
MRAGCLSWSPAQVATSTTAGGLKPLLAGPRSRHDPGRGRHHRPGKVHADKAYDQPDLRRRMRGKRIACRIARKGAESGQRLGRHRWVIERPLSWLSGYRRLSPRCEHDPRDYLAFLGLAAALTCYKRLHRLTTEDAVQVALCEAVRISCIAVTV